MTLTSTEQSTQTPVSTPLVDMSSSSFSPDQALATSTPSSLSRVSEYKEYDSCEELEMINGAGRYDHREEIQTLSAKLKEMETKWETLYSQHQEVVEERCELEEAENDSRLRAQK